MKKVFITRCATKDCPAKETCIRAVMPRWQHEQTWDYDAERGSGHRCQGFIRVKPEQVKGYC